MLQRVQARSTLHLKKYELVGLPLAVTESVVKAYSLFLWSSAASLLRLVWQSKDVKSVITRLEEFFTRLRDSSHASLTSSMGAS